MGTPPHERHAGSELTLSSTFDLPGTHLAEFRQLSTRHPWQECAGGPTWTNRGTHPLADAAVLHPTVLDHGYDLIGGTYLP